jgi:predicted ATPase with chaperone activity
LSGPLLDRVDLRVAMRPVKDAVGRHRLEHQC